jgi:hypothetical protein
MTTEDLSTTLKFDKTLKLRMPDRELPCGCTMQWDRQGTTLVFCSRHTLDYLDWDGTDTDFVKMVATPKKSGKADRIVLLEMR